MFITYDIRDRIADFECEEYQFVENNTCIAFFDGQPSNLLESFLSEANSDIDWMEAFIGPFVLVVYYKITGRIHIVQHYFGNGKNLYFCRNEEKIVLASSLNSIKKVTSMCFRLNVPMLPYYFYNGFLPGTHTLIDGVQKLETGTTVIIDGNLIRKDKMSFSDKYTDSVSCGLDEAYAAALEKSILDVTRDIIEPFPIALSAGYDSNCILYNIIRLLPDQPINAFSVGGVNGVDETGTAARIARCYQSVSFRSAFVSPETLDHLDEIVSALEGSVYERGIFLQYELASLLKATAIKHLICGECADQVFHKNTYSYVPDNTFLYGYLDTPFQMAVYVVLKKNRMIMDSFGIETRYPFLTPRMIEIGYKTRHMNGNTKEFHKAQCKKFLPLEVVGLIAKQGGSTNLASLFPEGFDCSAELEKRKFYSADFKLTGKYDHQEAIRDYYLSLLYLESFEKQFCDKY